MPEAAFKESETPLLRPTQVAEIKDEQKRLRQMDEAPPHIASAIGNPAEIRRQLRRIDKQLETQAPKAYEKGQMDSAVNRERQLREEILVGMPTQAEMRRNPSGAVDKHRGWETRNKNKILEWKNIKLRLHASGDAPNVIAETDLANFEKFRPVGGAQELNMHNEQIPGTDYHMPPSGVGDSVVFTDEDFEILGRTYPEIVEKMIFANADTRREVKQLIATLQAPQEPPPQADAPDEPVELNEYQELRERAKSLGINTFQKGKDAIRYAISEAEANLPVEE